MSHRRSLSERFPIRFIRPGYSQFQDRVKSSTWKSWFVVLFMVLAITTAYQQQDTGMQRLAIVIGVVTAMAILLVCLRTILRLPFLIPVIVWVAMTAATTLIFDTWSNQRLFWLDVKAIGLGILLVIALLQGAYFLKVHRGLHQVEDTKIPYIMLGLSLLGGWIGLSALPFYEEENAAQDSIEAVVELPIPLPHEGRRIGLALSGGGYRAAVFHAGVLHALDRLHLQPDIISSVSGGSIVGAHYATGGDPREFVSAVTDGRFNLKREAALIQNAVRLPFPFRIPYLGTRLAPWAFDRRDLQAEILERVLLGRDARNATPGRRLPLLILATTDLTHGSIIGFVHEGGIVEIRRNGDYEYYPRERLTLAREWLLPELVSMSGAFPGAFPATRVDLWGHKLKSKERSPLPPMQLVDGGVLDNQGLKLLVAMRGRCVCDGKVEAGDIDDCRRPALHSDVIFSSDAGALLGDKSELSEPAALMRALEVATVPKGSPSAIPYGVSFSASDLLQGQSIAGERDKDLTNDLLTRLPELPQPILDEILALAKAGHEKEWAESRDSDEETVTSALAERLDTFRSVATLDDQLTRREVDHLFSLGQMLVYLHWPDLVGVFRPRSQVDINDEIQKYGHEASWIHGCPALPTSAESEGSSDGRSERNRGQGPGPI